MSNVVSLASRRKKVPVLEIPVAVNNNAPPEAMEFVTQDLYQWALDNDVDLETHDFKYECATILTVLQGMLFRARK